MSVWCSAERCCDDRERQPPPSATSPGCSAPTAGHSSAQASNALYRTNLARGQTGLSVAFDLPTQTGYDSDHPLARGRGRQGRRADRLARRHGDAVRRHPARADEHLDDHQRHRALAAGALHRRGRASRVPTSAKLQGTVQNDIIKEYLSRGTYIFPPEPSMRLITDVIAYTYREMPKWNPTNVCSYHLQEAGATPVQELAYALATAVAGAGRGPRRRPGARGGLRPRRSAGSASSSMPASASSPSCARCAPSSSCGTRSAASATASQERSTACSATACRSTRWA